MRRGSFVVAVLASLLASLFVASPASAAGLDIEVLSNRADLVSGGDAFVRISLPDGADAGALQVDVGGRDISPSFARRANGEVLGVVKDMPLGENTVRARVGGAVASLTIINHSMGGPVIAGPQIKPWKCFDGSIDEQCNRPVEISYKYRPTGGGALADYDPENPPADVAETTTDEGKKVPFIVRYEVGTIDRDQYRIALLYDPSKPYEPWAPQDGFNHKLVIFHGASCDTGYEQADAPDVLNEDVLGKGFATMSHALDNAGHNCNIVTQAESLIMTKEHLIDSYGTLRYTIGSGCSGGSLTQQQVANAYPGVYQGITPACSFTDAWSSAMQYVEYQLMRRYLENPGAWAPGVAWDPTAIAAVEGHPNPANAITFTTAIASSGDPSRECPGVPPDQVYDEKTNPGGVRCSFQDYMVNVFGRRPADGFANRPADNVGVEYGRKALAAGTISPSQFVDLNAKLGGWDIDYNPTVERVAADPGAVERVYRSGAVDQADNLDQVAIIDLRGPDPGAFHDVYRTYAMRARLEREHGTAANQILWRGVVPLLGDATFTNEAIFAVDRWLAAVEKDTRPGTLAQKILRDKPEDVVDRCTNGTGVDVPAATCDAAVQSYSTPRIESGGPQADDTIKCNLKPLDRASYAPVVFTDDQWAQLVKTYPEGVCDWARPGVDRVPTATWQTYQERDGSVVYGGRKLNAPPATTAAGPAVCGAAVPYARFKRSSVAAARKRGAAGRRVSLAGTAKVRKGCGKLSRVEVAVGLRAGKRCRFVGASGALARKARSCSKPVFVRARGTSSWKWKSRKGLPAGSYLLQVRSVDSRGVRSPMSRKRRTIVGVRLR